LGFDPLTITEDLNLISRLGQNLSMGNVLTSLVLTRAWQHVNLHPSCHLTLTDQVAYLNVNGTILVIISAMLISIGPIMKPDLSL